MGMLSLGARHPTPSAALAIERREHQGDAGTLAGKASDDLRAPSRLAELGPLLKLGICPARPLSGGGRSAEDECAQRDKKTTGAAEVPDEVLEFGQRRAGGEETRDGV